jgi:CDGSH-type Zn-finger protein
MKKQKILISKNGPYIICGGIPLNKEIIVTAEDEIPTNWKKDKKYPKQENYALCRCGQSSNKPFCDGTHGKIGFKCDEIASKEKYDSMAEKIVGPNLILKDVPSLCSSAFFCHRANGTWNLVEKSDMESKKIAIQECHDCPSGRLVICDKKTGKAIEPKFNPSISIVEDPGKNVSGPIWVKGLIQLEASDGFKYEKRNRVTLCRCGKSENKPFCDGTHTAGFNDGDKSLNK